jgi:hypothetical protein
MSLTVVASGNQGPLRIGTETKFLVSALTPAIPSTYVLAVDCGQLAAGEVVFLRIYTAASTQATPNEAEVVFSSFIGGTDVDPNLYSVPIPVDVSWRPTITQLNGTGRTFAYKVFTL